MATNRRQQIQLSPDEQTAFFRERKKASLATIDKDGFPHVVAMNYFATVAEAFGFQAHTVRTLDELRALRPVLGKPEGPILLDCKVNAEIAAPFMGEFAEFEARHQ